MKKFLQKIFFSGTHRLLRSIQVFWWGRIAEAHFLFEISRACKYAELVWHQSIRQSRSKTIQGSFLSILLFLLFATVELRGDQRNDSTPRRVSRAWYWRISKHRREPQITWRDNGRSVYSRAYWIASQTYQNAEINEDYCPLQKVWIR